MQFQSCWRAEIWYINQLWNILIPHDIEDDPVLQALSQEGSTIVNREMYNIKKNPRASFSKKSHLKKCYNGNIKILSVGYFDLLKTEVGDFFMWGHVFLGKYYESLGLYALSCNKTQLNAF